MKVGIVGAGLTGLALQQSLAETGIESIVFESSAEPGGVIRSRTVDGQTLDFGPQRTRLSPPVASLVDGLGIEPTLREADDGPLYVYRDGALRRVPFSIGEAVTTDLLSLQGKLRLLLEPLTVPPRAGETVEESLTRTLGAEAAEYLVGPLYGGIYGSHPDEMCMEHSLLRAFETFGVDRSLLAAALRRKLRRSDPSPVVSFDGGMQTLPRTLYERQQDRIHLEMPVEAIRDSGEQFELETPAGVTTVDRVVLTTPADVTGTLLDDIAPHAASKLRELTYNPLALVHIVPETTLDATGFQVQYEEAFRTLGVTCNADLFDQDDHYTVFLGGARTPGLVDWSTSEIRETARREFSELTGVEGRVITVHRLRRGMPAYDTSWTALDRVETPPGVHLSGNYVSRAGIPGRIGEARRVAERLAGNASNGSGLH